MASAREQLLNQYAKGISGLQSTYQASFVKFIQGSLSQLDDPLALVVDPVTGENKTRLFIYMRESLPIFNATYLETAGSLGQAFYDLRRDQVESAGHKVGLAALVKNLPEGALDGILMPHWEVTGLIQKALRNDKPMTDVAHAVSNSLGDLVRAVSEGLYNQDSQAKTATVFTQGNACNYCKSIAADFQKATRRGVRRELKDVSFHAHCNCVIDYTYVGERSLIQPFVKEFEKKELEAIKIIDEGEGGSRVLQTGSNEWFSAKKQQVFSEMSESKHFKRMNVSEKDRFTQALDSIVKGTLDEKEENWLIERTSYDAYELAQPVVKDISSTTDKNVLAVMSRL